MVRLDILLVGGIGINPSPHDWAKFRCVPSNFIQLMIIMIHESATELYIPIFYILLQKVKKKTYIAMLYVTA
jgi:hypothetical protein